eukprot:1281625-Pleurochrysis_carterae.AAC.1
MHAAPHLGAERIDQVVAQASAAIRDRDAEPAREADADAVVRRLGSSRRGTRLRAPAALRESGCEDAGGERGAHVVESARGRQVARGAQRRIEIEQLRRAHAAGAAPQNAGAEKADACAYAYASATRVLFRHSQLR